jgi:uncharacterized iron-regulated membrane protein
MNQIIHKSTVQRSLSAHAAIGLIASALLYVVCLTGTVTVFYEEWQRLEQPNAPEMSSIAPDAVQTAVASVLASERGKKATEHLYVHMPTKALPRTTVTTDNQAVHLDERGGIAAPEQNGWSEFLLNLHYTLNVPGMIGGIVVGALGVMMLALSLTGIVAHPRIFRDAFRLRARDGAGVGLADWHNRLGVWTLPFSLAISLTGAMIGLAAINGYGLAQAFYKGDIEAAYAPIFGKEGKPDPKAAPLPDLGTALQTMAVRFPSVRPTYIIVHEPATAGQHVQLIAAHDRRLIYGENYNFDARGEFQGKTGLSDGEIGQQVAASSYNLHFGNYGGLPVKLAYFLFGSALCGMIAIGVSIWLGKRERRGYHHPRLRNGWHAIVWGVPFALSMTFLARLLIGNDAPFTLIFWLLTALAIVFGLSAQIKVKPILQLLLGAGVLGGALTAAVIVVGNN